MFSKGSAYEEQLYRGAEGSAVSRELGKEGIFKEGET